MTNKEAVNWLINIMADIGKVEHSNLWHYEQALIEIREMLESQPEPCEGDPRADVYYLAEKIGIHRLYALVVELRGEPEPCRDTVSRAAAIDAFWKLNVEMRPTAIDEVVKMLRELPSTQPERKKGTWCDVGSLSCRCSECGCKSPKEYSYCPNCGADMKGEQE